MPVTSTPAMHLYLHQPAVIFKARVNMQTFAYPLSALVFDTVTVGAFGDIVPDMTLTLGTAEGLDDLGRVRVQNVATATSIPIGRVSQGTEDGTLNVSDNMYITVLDDYRVWAKLPYISPTGIAYKDSDIAIFSFTTLIPPVANCGPGTAGTIASGTGLLTVQFPAGGATLSYAMADGATISTYLWDVKDGTITVGTSASAVITATFPAGFRWVGLTVTDSNGKVHTTRCPVLAVNPAIGFDVTIDNFQVEPHRLTQNGQTVGLRILEDLPRTTYPDGGLVLYWWGEPATSTDRSHMKLIGWHQSDSAGVRAQKTGLLRDTVLNCVDVAGRLDALPGFPQALERVDPATTWEHMPTLTISKALHYLIYWHSTALSLADFFLPATGDDYPAMRLDSTGASLYDQVNGRAKSMVPDHILTCNTTGQLRVLADWMLQDTADRPAVTATLTEDYWSELRFEYTRPPRVHVLRASAVVASTAWLVVDGEDTLPLAFSIAPGDAFSQGTSEATQGEQLAISQAALNACTGHRYARLNARYAPFSIVEPSGVIWAYEPALMARVALNVAAVTAAQRGLDFTTANGMVKAIDLRYSYTKGGVSISPTITWERETVGLPAQTVTPAVPEDVTDYVVPPPSAAVAPSYGLIAGVQKVALIDYFSDGGDPLYVTNDFQTASGSGGPTWTRPALTITDSQLRSFVVDPFSPGYTNHTGAGAVNGWVVGETNIWRIADMFGTPTSTIVHTFSTAINSNSKFHGRTIQASFGRFFATDAENPWLMVVSHYANTAGHTGTWATYSVDAGVTWSSEVQISSHYDTDIVGAEAGVRCGLYLSPKTPGLAYSAAYTNTANPATVDGFVTTDWGATWAALTNPDIQPNNRLAATIHVPWPTNADEKVVYHGHVTRGATLGYRLKRIESDGTTITDISPVVSSINYGVNRAGFGLRTYDSDRSRVVLGGTGNDTTALRTGDLHGLFVSSDNGTTWTTRITPIAESNFFDPSGFSAAFGGDSSDIMFIWGPHGGVANCIAYSSDFGATIDSRRGNLETTWPGIVSGLLGIAGGPHV